MTNPYLTNVAERTATPQTVPIPGTVPNNAGGQAYPVSDWTRLRRFLILGSEGGSFYQKERELTRENAACVERCLLADPQRTIGEILDVSVRGLAPKNEPALFALALAAAGPPAARPLALELLPQIARTGTHLLHFASYVNGLRGWGRGLRQAIARWYLERSVDDLALQLVKYPSRDGWSHRDLLRLSHPHAKADPLRDAALRFAVKGGEPHVAAYPQIIEATLIAQKTPAELPQLIREHRLPREVIPTEQLNRLDVWEALLEQMPMTAMIRNLGKMTEIGLIAPLSAAARMVSERLADHEQLRRARVHPFQVLLALRTYQKGQGFKGKLTWKPAGTVVDALDAAFYESFETLEPSGKRVLIGLDVSGSMDMSIAGSVLTAREAACAIAMVTARTEKEWACIAFAERPVQFQIGARERLDSVCTRARAIPMGRTDCAVPIMTALEQKIPVETFQVITDNETYAGHIHPSQALQKFRKESGIAARSAVVAVTSSGFTIADPNDAGMIDLCGMDASLPGLLAAFGRGDL